MHKVSIYSTFYVSPPPLSFVYDTVFVAFAPSSIDGLMVSPKCKNTPPSFSFFLFLIITFTF